MTYSDRTSDLVWDQLLTKTANDGAYVNPPDGCLYCLTPVEGTLLACGDFMIYNIAAVNATLGGVTVNTTLFNTHATVDSPGTTHITVCRFTGTGFAGENYGTADSDSSDVDVTIRYVMTWVSGSSSGSVIFDVDFNNAGTGWNNNYTGTILASTSYANEAAFQAAANAAIEAATSVSLSDNGGSGTPPTGVTFPSTIQVNFA